MGILLDWTKPSSVLPEATAVISQDLSNKTSVGFLLSSSYTTLMTFHPIDITPFHVGFTVLSAFVVVFGMFSLFSKEKLYIGEAVWATVFGIIVGPYCAGIFDPRDWGNSKESTTNEITLEVTRIVLAVGVFAIGVELPKAYVGRHWRSLTFLLVPIMVYGWFVCGALIYGLVPRLDFLSSLAIAACLTPTDPILAAAVVGGRYAEKHVPAHLRHLLAAESGVNDGAAFPMLFISLYLILERSDGVAVGEWFYITWAYEIILGTVLGGLLGYAFRHLMKYCERHDLIDRHSYVAQYVSLALLSNGITTLLGSDDLLASFACGTAFAYDGWFNKKTEESMFSNVIDLIFNCACFIYIGAWIPFDDFNAPELSITPWRLVIIALLVVLLRRLPIMIALYRWIPEVKTFREAVFSGHFGPMGVGAVFISTLALEQIPEFSTKEAGRGPETQLELLAASIQPIIAFIVLVSIAIHGLSIPFFSLGRRVHSISRTWSRHTSMDPGGQPEWAIQARRVGRAEDVVINHDPEPLDAIQKMERGELPARRPVSGGSDSSETTVEKNQLQLERDGLAVNGVQSQDGVTVRGTELERQPGGEGPEVDRDIDDEIRETDERLPDSEQHPGDVTEWREGPDLIIERALGDGEEVEVEVIRNRFDDNATEVSKVAKGASDAVRQHFEHDLKKAKDMVNDVEHEVKDRLSPTSSHPTTSGGSNGSAAEGAFPQSSGPGPMKKSDLGTDGVRVLRGWTPVLELEAEASGDKNQATEDENNADDESDGDDNDVDDNDNGEGSSSATPLRSRSKSPKPLKKSPTSKTPSAKTTRSGRRESFRRHLFGRGRPLNFRVPGRKNRRSSSPVEDEDAMDDSGGASGSEVQLTARRQPLDTPRAPGTDVRPALGASSTSGLGAMPRPVSPPETVPESRYDSGDESPASPNPAALRQRLNQHLGVPDLHHRRSESPGRSIRFADPGLHNSHSSANLGRLGQTHQHIGYQHRRSPSGTSTPRARFGSIDGTSGQPQALAPGPAHDNTSNSNQHDEPSRVTFDLPIERTESSTQPSSLSQSQTHPQGSSKRPLSELW